MLDYTVGITTEETHNQLTIHLTFQEKDSPLEFLNCSFVIFYENQLLINDFLAFTDNIQNNRTCYIKIAQCLSYMEFSHYDNLFIVKIENSNQKSLVRLPFKNNIKKVFKHIEEIIKKKIEQP